MTRRNRRPAPELPPLSLYVSAPVDSLSWAGRELVLHCSVVSACGKTLPSTALWRVLRVSDQPRRITVLAADECPHCNRKPRLGVEANLLRDSKIAGWLPQ